MYPYQPPVFRHPGLAQRVVVPTTPVVTTSVADTPATSPLAGAPVPEGLFWTAVAASAAYAGIRTATRKNESTFNRVVGWAGGVGAGLAALVGLTGILAPSTARTFPIRWYWI